MERNLLIHSMGEFSSITLPILEAVNAKVICEVGAEHGGNSKVLVDWLQQRDGKLISIDPMPSQAFIDWLSSVNIQHIAKTSHAAIPDVSGVDAWFIDGDHNWYTVFNELQMIRDVHRREQTPMLIFMHDVGWPCERRDMYYAPDQVPEEFRHPYSWDKGVTLKSAELIDGGFRSNGQFGIAFKEGGPQNGVLTAIEDFLRLYPEEFCFANVPAVFGLGVIFDLAHPHANAIANLLAPYHQNTLLKTLELNRLDNYLEVIRLQDEAVKLKLYIQSQHMTPMAKSNQTTQPAQLQEPNVIQPAQEIPDRISAPLANSVAFESGIQYQQFERMATNLVNVLSDEKDHPEVWKLLEEYKSPAQKTALKLFSDYLSKLLLIPQDETAFKIISVLDVMCLLHTDRVDIAQTKLRKIAAQHSQCPLVRSVLIQVGKAYATSR